MPSKQETFDTVVAHLRKQNAKSESPAPGVCLRNLGYDLRLVKDLQNIHDWDGYPDGAYESRLADVAREHGLIYRPKDAA